MKNFFNAVIKLLVLATVIVLVLGAVSTNTNPVSNFLNSIKNGSHTITAEILSSELREAKTLNTVNYGYTETAFLDSANAHWYIFEIPNTGSITQATYRGTIYYGIDLSNVTVIHNGDGTIIVKCPGAHKMSHEIDLSSIEFRTIRNKRLSNFQNSTADVYTMFTRQMAELKTSEEKQVAALQGEIDDKSRRKLKEFIDSLGFDTSNVVVVPE